MKIILGVDGSKYSNWATEWIARMPFREPPSVTAIHVLDIAGVKSPLLAQSVVVGNRAFIQAEVKRLETQAKQVQDETQKLLSSLQLTGKAIIKRGAVAETIIQSATRGTGLIVLGHRGLDTIDRFMLGSVSSRVAMHAPCSVLVVKQPPRPVCSLLLAVDGSKSSDKALQFLLTRLKPMIGHPYEGTADVKVTVLHIMPNYPEWKEAGQALVHRYADRLANGGYQVEELLRFGHPAEQILKTAERLKSDLTVCGAKGLGAITRFFLGSVSTRLVQHGACSVLVVR